MVSSVNGVLGYCLHGLGRPQNVLVLLIALISVFPFLLLSYFLLPVFLNAQRYEIIRAALIFLLYVPLSFFVAISSQVLQGLQDFRFWNLMRLFNALRVFSGT